MLRRAAEVLHLVQEQYLDQRNYAKDFICMITAY